MGCYGMLWDFMAFNHRKTIGKPWEYGGFMGFDGIYPLVNVYITNWRITISNGKTQYIYDHVQ